MATPAGSIYDVDMFFDSLLGIDVRFTPVGGSGKVIKGVFNETYMQSLGSQGAGFQNTGPSILVKAADVTSITVNALFLINAVTYYAMEIHPDAPGMKLILLSLEPVAAS